MVISTGITEPRWASVAALYALTNSMMLTPCGPRAVPTGGAGVAAPALSCTLTSAAIFFFGGMVWFLTWLRECAGRRAVGSDLLAGRGRGCAARLRARGGRRGRHDRGRQHLLDLLEAERDRLLAVADEPGHRRGVAHRGPRLVGQVHPHEHVAGEHRPLDELALAVLDLRDLLGRDDHLMDVVLHVEAADPALEVGLHPVLHAGVGVDHEPVAELLAQRGAELLERVDGTVLGGLGDHVDADLLGLRLGVVAGP